MDYNYCLSPSLLSFFFFFEFAFFFFIFMFSDLCYSYMIESGTFFFFFGGGVELGSVVSL